MLFEIIYHSQATPDLNDEQIDEILATARNFNEEHEITGCLLFHHGQFLQILEGEFNLLNELYEKIKKDTRHKNVITIHMQEIKDRLFDNWTMAYQKFDNQEALHNRIGLSELDELLNKDEKSSVPKEIFATMSQHILSSR